MDNEALMGELRRYEADLAAILTRSVNDGSGLYIRHDDDPVFRQYIYELIDLFHDALGQNSYSKQIAYEASQGVLDFIGLPSYKSVENILGIVRAAITRLLRNPDILERRKASQILQHRENVFIIHGRDEAKWRELKEIVRIEFRLNPIVLSEQPDAGCPTVIEKFERYASICGFAIALFTPDDEIESPIGAYLQARPNVIYELGWFCGRSGRGGAMLLLKEGTSLFSDFGGIIQKRFERNVSECVVEMKKDLVEVGILDAT